MVNLTSPSACIGKLTIHNLLRDVTDGLSTTSAQIDEMTGVSEMIRQMEAQCANGPPNINLMNVTLKANLALACLEHGYSFDEDVLPALSGCSTFDDIPYKESRYSLNI